MKLRSLVLLLSLIVLVPGLGQQVETSYPCEPSPDLQQALEASGNRPAVT